MSYVCVCYLIRMRTLPHETESLALLASAAAQRQYPSAYAMAYVGVRYLIRKPRSACQRSVSIRQRMLWLPHTKAVAHAYVCHSIR
jgi:hypothetical protein